jgi:hypothetical protein
VGPFVRDLLQELPRIPPRNAVDKGIEKGRVPLRKHRDRRGCGVSHVGSGHNGGQVPSALQFPKQHSASVRHESPPVRQEKQMLR